MFGMFTYLLLLTAFRSRLVKEEFIVSVCVRVALSHRVPQIKMKWLQMVGRLLDVTIPMPLQELLWKLDWMTWILKPMERLQGFSSSLKLSKKPGLWREVRKKFLHSVWWILCKEKRARIFPKHHISQESQVTICTNFFQILFLKHWWKDL